MSIKDKVQKIITIQSQIDFADSEVKKLKAEVLDEFLSEKEPGREWKDIGKATVVAGKKLQVVNQEKVIAKLEEMGLKDQYVSLKLNDLFRVKEFVKEAGMIEGIVEVEATPYLLVTAMKEEVVPVTA